MGYLCIYEVRDERLRRTVLQASLHALGDAKAPPFLPNILKPIVLWMDPNSYTFTGFERIDPGRSAVGENAQRWLVPEL